MDERKMPTMVSTPAARKDWFVFGSCLYSDLDPDTWFPISRDPDAGAEAKRVCAECLVRSRCLSESLRIRDVKGIWGGADELDRRKISRRGA